MENYTKVFSRTSSEFCALQLIANEMTRRESEKGSSIYYTVENCFFDYEQNWMYTTIIGHNPNETGELKSWQALSPKQQEEIIKALLESGKAVWWKLFYTVHAY